MGSDAGRPFDDYGVVAFSGAATIPVGGALLALRALPPYVGRAPFDRCSRSSVAHRRCARVHRPGILELRPGVPSLARHRPDHSRSGCAVGASSAGGVQDVPRLTRRRRCRPVRRRRRRRLASAFRGALLLSYLDLGWWMDTASRCSIAMIGARCARSSPRGTVPPGQRPQPVRADRRGGGIPRRCR